MSHSTSIASQRFCVVGSHIASCPRFGSRPSVCTAGLNVHSYRPSLRGSLDERPLTVFGTPVIFDESVVESNSLAVGPGNISASSEHVFTIGDFRRRALYCDAAHSTNFSDLPVEIGEVVVSLCSCYEPPLPIEDFVRFRGMLRRVSHNWTSMVDKEPNFWSRIVITPLSSFDNINMWLSRSAMGSPFYLSVRTLDGSAFRVANPNFDYFVVEDKLDDTLELVTDRMANCVELRVSTAMSGLLMLILSSFDFIDSDDLDVFFVQFRTADFHDFYLFVQDNLFSAMSSPYSRPFPSYSTVSVRHANTPLPTMAFTTSADPSCEVELPENRPVTWEEILIVLSNSNAVRTVKIDDIDLYHFPAGVMASRPFPTITTLDLRFRGNGSMSFWITHLYPCFTLFDFTLIRIWIWRELQLVGYCVVGSTFQQLFALLHNLVRLDLRMASSSFFAAFSYASEIRAASAVGSDLNLALYWPGRFKFRDPLPPDLWSRIFLEYCADSATCLEDFNRARDVLCSIYPPWCEFIEKHAEFWTRLVVRSYTSLASVARQVDRMGLLPVDVSIDFNEFGRIGRRDPLYPSRSYAADTHESRIALAAKSARLWCHVSISTTAASVMRIIASILEPAECPNLASLHLACPTYSPLERYSPLFHVTPILFSGRTPNLHALSIVHSTVLWGFRPMFGRLRKLELNNIHQTFAPTASELVDMFTVSSDLEELIIRDCRVDGPITGVQAFTFNSLHSLHLVSSPRVCDIINVLASAFFPSIELLTLTGFNSDTLSRLNSHARLLSHVESLCVVSRGEMLCCRIILDLFSKLDSLVHMDLGRADNLYFHVLVANVAACLSITDLTVGDVSIGLLISYVDTKAESVALLRLVRVPSLLDDGGIISLLAMDILTSLVEDFDPAPVMID
ncbi:hypothetical protein C8R44DRAFT_884875 [Mycena epipterygia]|nr:hypothetical protein C8R44DRAFT_884875 [Mycena epipterygia]